MATRLYLPFTSSAPTISPSRDAAWETSGFSLPGSDPFARRIARITKTADALTTLSFNTDNYESDVNRCLRQYIYGPVAAQTIGVQTVKFQARWQEAASGNNLFPTMGIRAFSGAGSLRGTILAVSRDTDSEMSSSSLQNRQYTKTTTSLAVLAGDYIVIEIGCGGDPSSGNDHQCDIRLGDSSGSDLSEDNTSTTDNNPWVEFANTINVDAAFAARSMHYSLLGMR